MTKIEPKDLTGDVVFDYLKTQVLEGHEMVGGHIEEKKIAGPKDPRVIIHTWVKDLKSKKTNLHEFNYKKFE